MDKSYRKICKKCGGSWIKKDGFKYGRQRYKCKNCNHVFQNKHRKRGSLDMLSKEIWNKYAFGKQTYSELGEEYNLCKRSIQSILDTFDVICPLIVPTNVILLIDTTYFGDIGLMVFKDSKLKKVIHHKLVKNESSTSYILGIQELQHQGWKIDGIVCDGKKGLLGGFGDIPTQMCHFHQVAILRRYITKRPILQANKDLKKLGELICQTDKETFEYELNRWYVQYSDFLQEKKYNEGTKKYEYIHKRTRSAYFSLKRNLKYLFTWYDYLGVLDIPNTTNALEGLFSHLKGKVSLHRGLKKKRKIKLILSLLHGKT